MKITKRQLTKIIQEELQNVLSEITPDQQAWWDDQTAMAQWDPKNIKRLEHELGQLLGYFPFPVGYWGRTPTEKVHAAIDQIGKKEGPEAAQILRQKYEADLRGGTQLEEGALSDEDYIKRAKARAAAAGTPKLVHPAGKTMPGGEQWYDTDPETGKPIGGYGKMSKAWRREDIEAIKKALGITPAGEQLEES